MPLISRALCLMFWTLETNKTLIELVMCKWSLLDAQKTSMEASEALQTRSCGKGSLRSAEVGRTLVRCIHTGINLISI